MAFDPDFKGDNDWLLGLAKLRAQQILNLIGLYQDGGRSILIVLKAIKQEAQAILDDKS